MGATHRRGLPSTLRKNSQPRRFPGLGIALDKAAGSEAARVSAPPSLGGFTTIGKRGAIICLLYLSNLVFNASVRLGATYSAREEWKEYWFKLKMQCTQVYCIQLSHP